MEKEKEQDDYYSYLLVEQSILMNPILSTIVRSMTFAILINMPSMSPLKLLTKKTQPRVPEQELWVDSQ